MSTNMEKILHELKTLCCFLVACLLLPVLLLSFVCAHYSNALVNYILSIKYPTLTVSKSRKIRTLIDTPRNAGIFHFLLQIKGPCNFDKIKQHYAEHLTDQRDKAGYLRFPKLRQKLVTCWGHYAWVNDSSAFNINNHVLLSSRTYRGRPVNDSNIQEFVSDLVTKYMPSDLPQWQVIVIPSALGTTTDADGATDYIEDEHFYILVKVHHLIVAEEEDLHISEMLMMTERGRRPHIELIDDYGQMPPNATGQTLAYFVRQPVHIVRLLRHIGHLIVGRWSEFIYEFESLETPDGNRCVRIANVTQLLSVLLIVLVNVCAEYWHTMRARESLQRRYRAHKHHAHSRWTLLVRLLRRETAQRNLGWAVAYRATRHSWHPVTLARTIAKCLWQLHINYVVLLPYRVYCELLALREILVRGQAQLHVNTFCGRASLYLPMLLYAQIELLKICLELYRAPANIYEELFEHTSKQTNILQLKSYSGRKIVSFSRSIDACALRARNDFAASGVTESDFTLACLAGAIHDYLAMYAQTAPVPQRLNTTCRTLDQRYFSDSRGDKMAHIGGIVFLPLPLRAPDAQHVRELHAIVEQIRRKQTIIYLASMWQTRFDVFTALLPRVLTKVAINFFSVTFPVTLTEIHGPTADFHTLWGQPVEDVLLFRPPQSKTCLSLNVHRFGDRYRLACMADTQLGHEHAIIPRSFERYMDAQCL